MPFDNAVSFGASFAYLSGWIASKLLPRQHSGVAAMLGAVWVVMLPRVFGLALPAVIRLESKKSETGFFFYYY